MKKLRILLVLFVMSIVTISLSIPSTAQYDAKPRCWAVDDVCQVRADNVWDSCRADGGWYLTCYMVYSATYSECMSANGCEGQGSPRIY